ncbi:uncharacterized protein LOC114467343 isoform X2 [Gouania willdenowi]|uniref:uncharacterized protein LOC114467343 isoform X2 n=1 Tax=Gouania willdenowi TaxID=441366 RepID=UPI001055CDBE|nr:uncharacterized protein LOC114467343 isoform X2 [Gouania willdenowi]
MHRQRIEMALILPLVLLSICCVSAAEPQDEAEKVIISNQPAGNKPQSVLNQQQHCIPDINSVLRDISVQLAEVKVEVKHLQRQNEAQAAELVTIKTKANISEKQVEALRKDREVRQVAFSAALLVSGSETTTIGPFNTHTNLIFKNVFENIGNAYNPETGLFTAPVRGAYHFEFYIFGPGETSHPSAAILMKNEQKICFAYDHQPSYYVKSANGATLLLEVGDIVFVRQWENSKIYDTCNNHNTFSGHLLFTM